MKTRAEERKAFSFYYSHWEVLKELNDSQKAKILTAICEIQFLEKNIEDIEFKDQLLKLVWLGMKHAIHASVKGYCDKTKKDYPPLGKGVGKGNVESGLTPAIQGEEKGEEKEEEKEKEEYTFSFSLKNTKKITSLSKEYLTNLEQYVISLGSGNMTFQDFSNSCEMKGYKYTNFKMAYDKWGKGNPKQANKKQDYTLEEIAEFGSSPLFDEPKQLFIEGEIT